MMDDLRDLYQEVILDHGKSPRNFRATEDATGRAHGNNPLCGDQLTVFMKVDDRNVVEDASFIGRGCAISMASASMMTEVVRGKSKEEGGRLFGHFHAMCTGLDSEADQEMGEEMQRLQVLSGVREFPVRVKCATLAWHTMQAALKGEAEVTTESP